MQKSLRHDTKTPRRYLDAAKVRYATDPVFRAQCLAYAKAYKSTPQYKTKRKLLRARRRMKKTQLRQRLWFLQKGRCAWCQRKMGETHLDHVMPVARGGTNQQQNFQLLCPPCNLMKGSSDPIVFAQRHGKLL